jgi:uncharacterized membrane protein YhaH (DUF805 family)
MLSAPVLQLTTALLVLLSASMLQLIPETQASSIQVVLNSVALGFILEVDNKVGQMIAAQHELWAAAHAPQSSMAHSYAAKGSVVNGGLVRCFTSSMGHAYFAVVGLLLCLEPVLLAPHAAVAILAIATKSIEYGVYVDPVRFSQVVQGLTNSWSAFLAVKNYKSKEEEYDYSTEMREYDLSTAMAGVYGVVVLAIVLLLFHKPLPSAARRWPYVLLTLQAVTAVVAAIYPLAPTLDMHFCSLSMVFVTWLCMFIVWPICHKEKQPDRICCCHGNCESCCTICCSGCGPAVAARCGACCEATC